MSVFLEALQRRFHGRSLADVAALGRLYAHNVARTSTPRKLANYLLVQAEKRLKVGRMRGMPYRYRIEPLNVCNLRCPVCATGLQILPRPKGKLSLERYQGLVDQIAPYAYSLILFHLGEPLLHPDLCQMIAYAHSKRISVIINSHLNNLDEALARDLVGSGLALLNVSIDGSTEEVYQKYRVGGRLETVLRNLSLLAAEKERQRRRTPLINVRFLVMKQNEHQLEAVRRLAQARGLGFSTGRFFFDYTNPAQVAQWQPGDPAYHAHTGAGQEVKPALCADLWEHMTIYQDGNVVPCCWFNHDSHMLGNAWQTPLREMWNGRAYIAARSLFKHGADASGAPATCQECLGRPLQSELFVKNLHPVEPPV